MADRMTQNQTRPLRLALGMLAVVALGACQAGLDPAERAAPAEVPPGLPAAADAQACWDRDILALEDGATEERLFAVPCPDVLDVQFWSSLQRALAVRGHFDGPVNGIADAATRAAVRSYQAPLGLDSPVLSLDAARQLGLLAWPREQL